MHTNRFFDRKFLAPAVLAILTLLAGCTTVPFVPVTQPPPPPPPQPDRASVKETPLPPLRLEGLTDDEKNTVILYRALNRGVVNVTSVGATYMWMSQSYPTGGMGSGSIIDEDGLVLTNYHVISSAEHVTVILYDGLAYPAQIVGVDPENDLALVRFRPEGRKLTVIPLGSSDGLQVGQKVLALGNPYGLERTLTTGVISGLKRPLQTEQGFVAQDHIQTDASINPGNSGGPLLDSEGKMIGINTMILSPSGGSVGIGFAVPVNVAKRVIPDLKAYGRVNRGWIDIIPVPITESLARHAGLRVTAGVLVSEVKPGSLAEEAGIRGGQEGHALNRGRASIYLGGDIIVAVNGEPVTGLADYFGALESTEPGDEVVVEVLRGDMKIKLSVVLAERPESMRW